MNTIVVVCMSVLGCLANGGMRAQSVPWDGLMLARVSAEGVQAELPSDVNDVAGEERVALEKQFELLDDRALFSLVIDEVRSNSEERAFFRATASEVLAKRSHKAHLALLMALFHDSSPEVLGFVFGFYAHCVKELNDQKTRQLATEALTASMVDWLQSQESSELKSGALLNIRSAMDSFVDSSADFNEAARSHLERAWEVCIDRQEEYFGTIRFVIKMSGIAGMESARPYLARIVEADKEKWKDPGHVDGAWMRTLTWAAMKASARIYESSDIYACIATVKRHSSSPYKLLEYASSELTYIRRPEIADFLLPFTEDTTSYNANSMIPYACRADQAASAIVSMMPVVRAQVAAEAMMAEERRGAPLTLEEEALICRKYAADKNNWKYIAR